MADAKKSGKKNKGKNKGGGGGQGGGKSRSPIGLWQVFGLCMIVVAGSWHFGRSKVEFEGFVQPRQIHCVFVDGDGARLSGVLVQRQVCASSYGPQQYWHDWAGPSDANGACVFAMGGSEATGGVTTYFWGLYKKARRDHPVVEYRFARDSKALLTLCEEQLLLLPEAGRIDPNDTVFAEPPAAEMLAKTDGKVVACVMKIAVTEASASVQTQGAAGPK